MDLEKLKKVEELLSANPKLKMYQACSQVGVSLAHWQKHRQADKVKAALEIAASKAEAALELQEVDDGLSLSLLPQMIRDIYRLHFEKTKSVKESDEDV